MTDFAHQFLCRAECGVFRSKVALSFGLCATEALLPWSSACILFMLQGSVMICAYCWVYELLCWILSIV